MARENQERGEDGRYRGVLTKKLQGRLIEGVQGGLFDAQNALKNGIDITTLKSWVDRGLDEEAEDPYRSFAEAYVQASIAHEEKIIRRILEAAEPWEQNKESNETQSGGGFEGDDGYDSTDAEPSAVNLRKQKKERALLRGDWRAAAWYLERRWPLRWGITRQPEGGPKEALNLPDGQVNRKRKVQQMAGAPPPELIKLFRDAGFDLVRREVKP